MLPPKNVLVQVCTYLDKNIFQYIQDPGSSKWLEIQYFQDPGFLKWVQIQYFQDPGSLKWLETQYFQDPSSQNLIKNNTLFLDHLDIKI